MEDNLIKQSEYARLKNVKPPYISKLIRNEKLKVEMKGGYTLVVNCVENDKLFKNSLG